jgi:hypothetical protein
MMTALLFSLALASFGAAVYFVRGRKPNTAAFIMFFLLGVLLLLCALAAWVVSLAAGAVGTIGSLAKDAMSPGTATLTVGRDGSVLFRGRRMSVDDAAAVTIAAASITPGAVIVIDVTQGQAGAVDDLTAALDAGGVRWRALDSSPTLPN